MHPAKDDEIYDQIIKPATSPYDRPTADDRKAWPVERHYDCLVYQVCRNLACDGEEFEGIFGGTNQNRVAVAKRRMREIIRLVNWFVYYYTRVDANPSNLVEEMERLHPCPNPAHSPLPSVRHRHAILNMTWHDLRKTVQEKCESMTKQELVDVLNEDELRAIMVERAKDDMSREECIAFIKKAEKWDD